MSFVYLLAGSSVIYLFACWFQTLLDARNRAKSLYWIIGIGVLCRVVLLPSTPILEIDLYRYLWDGQLMNQTANPYKFAPIEFVQWQYPPESQLPFTRSDRERDWIQAFVSERDDSMQENLAIVANHFGQFTTPYPPVSQIVFAASDACCPYGTSSANSRYGPEVVFGPFRHCYRPGSGFDSPKCWNALNMECCLVLVSAGDERICQRWPP